jgi:hypothetical protein
MTSKVAAIWVSDSACSMEMLMAVSGGGVRGRKA